MSVLPLVIAPRARLFLACLAAVACARSDTPGVRADTAAAVRPARADTALPSGPLRDAVLRGRALLAATRDSLPANAPSSLRCFSCHLDEGRRESALPLTRSYVHFPQYRARSARVELIEDRINDCFVRSLNGRPLNRDGADMRDIIAYLSWLGRGAAPDVAGSAHDATFAQLTADTARGAAVFTERCARCHGANGAGIGPYPPLWGPKSFNIGAGMTRYRTSALFVLHNMPFDQPNTLTPQQALDVARFIGSRPRPDFAGKERDWPKGGAPPDVPYTTRAAKSGADTARTGAHNGAR